jgi:hypothetical protein
MKRLWKPTLALLVCTLPLSASSWPGSPTGSSIGTGLTSLEISGVSWDNFTGKLYSVADEGTLVRMERDGASTVTWPVLYVPNPANPTVTAAPDLESIAVTGTTPNLYLGVEYDATSKTAKILEIPSSNLPAAGTTVTAGKSWNLPASGLKVSSSQGMEGLTWVPNGGHPYTNSTSGGVFYASTQQDGSISVFDVNLSTSGSTPTQLGTPFKPDPNQSDISDLYYSAATRTLFVLYDNANQVIEIDTSTTAYEKIATYALPASPTAQEGVTTLPQCPGAKTTFYIGNDSGGVYSFSNFPQLCATTYAATGDATINQTNSTTPYGTAATLTADTSPVLSFLIAFPSAASQGSLARVRLRLYVSDGTTQSPSFCGTTGSWSQSSVTWSTAPACAGSSSGGNTNVDSGAWIAYNLTTPIATYSSFRFTGRSSNDFVASSSEAAPTTGSPTDRRPQLVVWTGATP